MAAKSSGGSQLEQPAAAEAAGAVASGLCLLLFLPLHTIEPIAIGNATLHPKHLAFRSFVVVVHRADPELLRNLNSQKENSIECLLNGCLFAKISAHFSAEPTRPRAHYFLQKPRGYKVNGLCDVSNFHNHIRLLSLRANHATDRLSHTPASSRAGGGAGLEKNPTQALTQMPMDAPIHLCVCVCFVRGCCCDIDQAAGRVLLASRNSKFIWLHSPCLVSSRRAGLAKASLGDINSCSLARSSRAATAPVAGMTQAASACRPEFAYSHNDDAGAADASRRRDVKSREPRSEVSNKTPL